MARPRTAQTVSAGGIVYRHHDHGWQIALVGQSERNVWGLPKGGPLKGETTEETALREVREETGLIARLVRPLDSIEYWFFSRGTRFHKTVHYFLMEAVGGDIAYHDSEYDQVQWFDATQAVEQASYDNEREAIRQAITALSAE
ncbi:MAG: NUDIX hydrolase [Chloroflexi bacterium]|nr:NUDIX hydrolase [Chloroflexota bacterium]MCL5109674.1 NUDIX hydrolase [Chloroflexota bacterium]